MCTKILYFKAQIGFPTWTAQYLVDSLLDIVCLFNEPQWSECESKFQTGAKCHRCDVAYDKCTHII